MAKAEEAKKEGEGEAPKKGSKKMLVIIIAVVVLLLGGGGAAMALMGGEKKGTRERGARRTCAQACKDGSLSCQSL